MHEQWIPSSEAIELIARRYDDSGRYAEFEVSLSVAQDALLKRLASGALRSRAAKGEIFWGDPFLNPDNRRHIENDSLPASFWTELKGCKISEREADWVLGDFSYCTGYNEHCSSGAAFDVHFDASSIPGALALLEASAGSNKRQNGAGRPPRFDWPEIVLAIFGLIFRDELRPKNQAEVERALLQHLTDGDYSLSESTVRPYAKKIWDEYKRPEIG